MPFSALVVDFYCQSSQLLAGHFDTTLSISGEVRVKPKTSVGVGVGGGCGEIAGRRSHLCFYFYVNALFFLLMERRWI